MNKVKLMWIANKMPTPEILHSLYTSIRFLNVKVDNIREDFKIWNDGRSIFIIMDEDKIENKTNLFTFGDIKIKLLKQVPLYVTSFQKGDIVDISGIISYAVKHFKGLNKEILGKPVESCPINMEGKFKPGLKQKFLNYLEEQTGLKFTEMAEDKQRLRFERLFTDEKEIYNKTGNRKKVFFKNIILISGVLEVIDAQKVNSLSYKMIGKKKSYGLGGISIEKLN
ncbi:TPA: hypothetical protein NV714_003519 [Escherichia coli]|nr:hypothetical protein [Escherichia coli]